MVSLDILHLALMVILFVTFIVLTGPKESRHFIGLKFRKKGAVSLISMDPAGGVRLRKIKWNGKYFEEGKKAIFFGFDMLSNPDSESKKLYNDILSKASYWGESRFPVLMAHESGSFISNPQFVHMLQQAREAEPFVEKKEKIQKMIDFLNPKTSIINILEPFDASVIKEYVESSTAAEQRTTFEMGEMTGKLWMTKPKLAAMGKFIIPIALILLVILLWQSGALQQFLGGFSK